jgi:hypothetical protein
MRGAIPPFLQYVFMAWCLIKHRDNFTFTIVLLTFHYDQRAVLPLSRRLQLIAVTLTHNVPFHSL